MTYHFYLFVGKFPKLFNFSDDKGKSYLVELNIFKENAFYGFQKILLHNFPQNFYIWSAIVNGTCMQKIKISHRAKFRAKSKCFPQILFPVRTILRSILTSGELILIHSADTCILLQIARACSEKPFRATLTTQSISVTSWIVQHFLPEPPNTNVLTICIDYLS